MAKLTDAHRADLQSYIDFYRAWPSCRDDRWPGSIASAIEAALQTIDELEAIVATDKKK